MPPTSPLLPPSPTLPATGTSAPPKVFMAFFGGAGDGPGFFHTRIVESRAAAAVKDPASVGLSGVEVDPRSPYLVWADAFPSTGPALGKLSAIVGRCLPHPIVVVGHSYGAHAAVRTIERLRPTPIRHLVTIDGVSHSTWACGANKPCNVQDWTNVYVTGFTDFSDVISTLGGHWGKVSGATRNINATAAATNGQAYSHAAFSSLWQLAAPHVRTSLGLK